MFLVFHLVKIVNFFLFSIEIIKEHGKISFWVSVFYSQGKKTFKKTPKNRKKQEKTCVFSVGGDIKWDFFL